MGSVAADVAQPTPSVPLSSTALTMRSEEAPPPRAPPARKAPPPEDPTPIKVGRVRSSAAAAPAEAAPAPPPFPDQAAQMAMWRRALGLAGDDPWADRDEPRAPAPAAAAPAAPGVSGLLMAPANGDGGAAKGNAPSAAGKRFSTFSWQQPHKRKRALTTDPGVYEE